MRNANMGAILEGLHSRKVFEATQGLHIVRYTASNAKDACFLVNTREYNKLKKVPGYKELDHHEIGKGDSPTRFYNDIKDTINKYGLISDPYADTDDGKVVGKYGKPGYGYILYPDSKIEPSGYGFNK